MHIRCCAGHVIQRQFVVRLEQVSEIRTECLVTMLAEITVGQWGILFLDGPSYVSVKFSTSFGHATGPCVTGSQLERAFLLKPLSRYKIPIELQL